VQLCLEGFYEGLIFHRVVPGFIVQTGDPTGSGSGGQQKHFQENLSLWGHL
jgi:peptidyl-prolyl cis-trans isomerase SDCCAG10